MNSYKELYYERCPRCFNTRPHNQYHKSVNSSNRPEIVMYIIERFHSKSTEGKITITDAWDVTTETSVKFNITDYMAEKLTWEILQAKTGVSNE